MVAVDLYDGAAAPSINAPYSQHESFYGNISSNVISTPRNISEKLSMSQIDKLYEYDEDLLDIAGRKVDHLQNVDSSFADLRFKLGLTRFDHPSISGAGEDDYPATSRLGLPADFIETDVSRLSPIPSELQDRLKEAQCNTLMGLFPEISRAWITVDSVFYVWNYQSSLATDLAFYDRIPHTIVAVCLVKPKSGVVDPRLSHMVCIATSFDIFLIGVSWSTGSYGDDGEIEFMSEPLFRLPLDAVQVTAMTTTVNGRIFFGASDGFLYEVQYNYGWLYGRSCGKKNHSISLMNYLVPSFIQNVFGENEAIAQMTVDESRHILYCRSDVGSLQVFDLGFDGMLINRIAKLSAKAIQYDAMMIAQNVEPSNLMPIIYIAPISCEESSFLNFLAVTVAGIRLYFSCYPANDQILVSQTPTQDLYRPKVLRLMHVRLPPGFSVASNVLRPTNVHTAFAKSELSMWFTCVDKNSDCIWTLNSAEFPFQPHLSELHNEHPIDGRCWAIAEMTQSCFDSLNAILVREHPTLATKVLPPPICRQHVEPERRFVVLTNRGIHFMTKHRPMDMLSQLLAKYGVESMQFRAFVTLHGAEQICAMLLCLICLESSGQDVGIATKALFACGAFPSQLPPQTLGAAEGLNPRSGYTPYSSPMPIYASTPINSPQYDHGMQNSPMIFTALHDAFYLYFSRIIAPLWQAPIVIERRVSISSWRTVQIQLQSSFKIEELSMFLEQLQRLKSFIDSHAIVSAARPLGRMMAQKPVGMDHSQAAFAKRLESEIAIAEKQSLLRFYDLLRKVVEVLGLWIILNRHELHSIGARLPSDMQGLLKTLTFKDIIIRNTNLCNDLCTALLSMYLDDHATVDAMVSQLQQACPNLYTVNDAATAKASELIYSVKDVRDPVMKRKKLEQALKLYCDAGEHINLPTVAQQFEEALYYDGLVELVLTIARKMDPQNYAFRYFLTRDETMADANRAYLNRETCYQCLVDALQRLQIADQTRFPVDNRNFAAETIAQVLRMCFESNDELCHFALIQWMMDRNMIDQLLENPPAALESFLRMKMQCDANGTQLTKYCDTLWRLYEKRGQYMKAVNLLLKLAEIHSTSIDLNKRLQFLARAEACLKAAEMGNASAGSLWQTIEDKREVAEIQKQILNTLAQLVSNSETVEAVQKLNADLFDVQTLYEDFADAFNLHRCKLALIVTAGVEDKSLVESLWSEIFEEEMRKLQHMDSASRMRNFTEIFIDLTKTYKTSKAYFPEDFIINLLFETAITNHFNSDWLSDVVWKAGLSVTKLFRLLQQIYRSKEQRWNNRQMRFLIMECLLYTINLFADHNDVVPSVGAKNFKLQCDNCVASCLLDLQTQGNVAALVDRFQSVESKLHAMQV